MKTLSTTHFPDSFHHWADLILILSTSAREGLQGPTATAYKSDRGQLGYASGSEELTGPRSQRDDGDPTLLFQHCAETPGDAAVPRGRGGLLVDQVAGGAGQTDLALDGQVAEGSLLRRGPGGGPCTAEGGESGDAAKDSMHRMAYFMALLRIAHRSLFVNSSRVGIARLRTARAAFSRAFCASSSRSRGFDRVERSATPAPGVDCL